MVVFAGRGEALRHVWDGESDHWLSPLSTKPSQGLIDVQDGFLEKQDGSEGP